MGDLIRVPFGYLLEFLYHFTNNYGIALILFALLVKVILFPLSMKSKKSTMKMSRLSPQLKALERKYGDDKVKYQQAVQALYREEGISTFGGCLWSLLPLLILLPLYQVVRQPIVYMMHQPADVAQAIVTKLTELGVDLGKSTYYQQMVAASKLPQYLPELKAAIPELANATLPVINFSFLGIDLSAIPSFKFWTITTLPALGLFLVPIVSGASNWFSMWVSQKLNASVSTNAKGEKDEMADTAAGTMKGMMLTMPLISIYIGFTMPAAVSVYWVAQALVTVLQELILTKHYRKVYDAEDAIKQQKAAEAAALEAEKERVRAERRAANPDGIVENTSKKKLKAREKAERGPAIEGKLTPEEREALRQKKARSGDPDRPYSRGRAYEPNRYAKDGTERIFDETEAPAAPQDTADAPLQDEAVGALTEESMPAASSETAPAEPADAAGKAQDADAPAETNQEETGA